MPRKGTPYPTLLEERTIGKGSPMLHIVATLHTFGLQLTERARRTADADERGNVTIEHVLWAVAVIAIVATVVGVIRAFVTAEAGKIG